MTTTKCGYCGKENDESAVACPSCGNSLKPAVATQQSSYPAAAKARILRGGLWLGGGLVVTMGSLMTAGPGGTLWVAWGAIAYGIFQLVMGLIDARKPPARLEMEEALEREFQTAVLLEARGDIQRARVIYESLARNYADTRVGRNAKNTIESMPASRPDMN